MLIAAMFVLVGAAGADTATLTVCPSGCQYATIPAALAVAHHGDTIAVGPGTYSGGFTIHASINLVGAGRRFTTISGGGSVVTIARGTSVTISKVTITEGHAEIDGGGIDNDGTLTLTKSFVSDNEAGTGEFAQGQGGGIYNDLGRLTIANCTVEGNAAETGAGIRNFGGVVLVAESRIIRNRAVRTPVGKGAPGGSGGGIFNSGVFEPVGTLVVVKTAVIGNRAGIDEARGAGIDNRGVASLDHSLVQGNTAFSAAIVAFGGGIYNAGTMTLKKTPVVLNSVSAEGGQADGAAIWNDGALRLHESPLTRNTAEGDDVHGGGLFNRGTAVLSKSPVWRNIATGLQANAFGGGIMNAGGLTLIKSPVTANTATAGPFGSAHGGGIHNAFALFLTRIDSPVTGNTPDDCFGC
jgi:hypothetical protein